ncbi:thiolase family protein [Dietzia psychralcaliphila]|uniref:thiolase family protein n=1 Tax=Dietzia psychralcaliphila TaxID=139021 RepID=UPI001C1E830A|nr:thiolase family protein [Dietzia psychralcaliphila]
MVVGRGRAAPPYAKILVDAALDAIADAGLVKDDIDGLILSSSIPQPFELNPAEVAEHLGIELAYVAMAPYGGRPAVDVLHLADSAIKSGQASKVLVLSADNFATTLGINGAVELYMTSFDAIYERPFGPIIPTAFALMAQQHMHTFGTTMEQLAAVPVTFRRHGLLNPDTEVRGELTIDSVIGDTVTSSPLTRSMLALISTGGGQGFVVTDEPTSSHPVRILGYGESCSFMSLSQAPSLVAFDNLRQASDRALGQAGLGVRDLDFLQVYDPASIVPLIILEDIGYCAKGEAGAFFAEGNAGLGGALPINTHGGTMAFRHPGMGAALDSVVESVRQLRGTAGKRQVVDAELGMIHGQGSWLANNGFLVLGRV